MSKINDNNIEYIVTFAFSQRKTVIFPENIKTLTFNNYEDANKIMYEIAFKMYKKLNGYSNWNEHNKSDFRYELKQLINDRKNKKEKYVDNYYNINIYERDDIISFGEKDEDDENNCYLDCFLECGFVKIDKINKNEYNINDIVKNVYEDYSYKNYK